MEHEVDARNGGLCRRNEPMRCESYVSILRRAGRDNIECVAAAPAPLEMKKYSMHSYGAQFCEVRVNEVTGETRVSRWLGSFDTGRILNPKTAKSQFRGGIIMGLGLALTEETMFDERSGRIMNPSLAEYHVPVHLDVPEIDVIWTGIPDPHAPLGLHGIGEIGITGVGAAVANAVYNATGKRIRELPITLDKVLGAQAPKPSAKSWIYRAARLARVEFAGIGRAFSKAVERSADQTPSVPSTARAPFTSSNPSAEYRKRFG
jgi:xanthine dehydrogenase YagR molybdenum-binding subunit